LSTWDQDGLILFGFHVDNCLVVGKDNQINKLIVEFNENGFNLKIERDFKEYLSRCVIHDANLKQFLILQPNLIKDLQSKFGEELKGKKA
jgi:hypothetical protein